MKQRIITGVFAGAGFLLMLAIGGYGFAALIAVLSVIGYYEFLRMNGAKPWEWSSVVGFLGIVYFVVPFGRWTPAFPPLEIAIWLWLLVFLAVTVISKNREPIDKIALSFLGVVYIGTGFHFMIYTRWLEHGLFWTLLLFVCIWVSDSAAYFTGRAIGKRLLWPEISPKKTVEGAVGGIAFSVAAAIGFSLYAPELLSVSKAVGIGLAASVLGQLGDLIESAYKRVRGIKDSGAILPGHGGVLDRCDSWLIVFPFVHLLSLLP